MRDMVMTIIVLSVQGLPILHLQLSFGVRDDLLPGLEHAVAISYTAATSEKVLQHNHNLISNYTIELSTIT